MIIYIILIQLIMVKNVFLYWVGQEYKLIKILRDLIIQHSKINDGYNVHLINHDNINEYIKDIPDYFYNLKPAHQADFVRINVICEYGGIYLDGDTLIIESLDYLFDIISNKDGFFIIENDEIICNGVFGSKKDTELMKTLKTEMLGILESRKEHITWTEIGGSLLQGLYDTNPHLYDQYEIFNGLQTMYPVNWNHCVNQFLKEPYEKYVDHIREFQPLLILVNSVYKEMESLTYDEILNGKTPLNYFINKSFDNLKIDLNDYLNHISEG